MFLKCGKRDGIEDSLNLPPLQATGLKELEPRNLHEIKCIDGYEIKKGSNRDHVFSPCCRGGKQSPYIKLAAAWFSGKGWYFAFSQQFSRITKPYKAPHLDFTTEKISSYFYHFAGSNVL